MPEEKKIKIKVKFLESGIPFGFAYGKDKTVTLEITQTEFNKLLKNKIVTKQ